ncbi:MAG: hypothetical protein IKV97_03445, partial [Clostridia bacterium]|nr:hypothetical protein [Clostridia bacterium]
MGNHEYLRMPMAYIAAWGVSGDEHWLELYRNLRAEAYERSKPMSEYWHLYALQQMQASVLVCYELENDEVWKEKYLSLMNSVADYTENKAGNVLNEISRLCGFNVPYCSFREASQELSKSMDDMGLAAICPRRADEHQFWVLQDAANLVIVPTYVPERKACSKAVEAFEQGFSKIDFSKYERCVPVHYLEGYYRNI